MGEGHGVKSLIRKEFQEAMGGVNSKGGPLLSWINRGLRHGAHPLVVGSNCLERYATGAKEGPVLCPRTPRANPCLSEM
jgi:hypothetical protein